MTGANWRKGYADGARAVGWENQAALSETAHLGQNCREWCRRIVSDGTLSAAEKHVALTLALHLENGEGEFVLPSVRKLSKECGRKSHTVIDACRALEERGYLAVDRGGAGALRRTNAYVALLDGRPV